MINNIYIYIWIHWYIHFNDEYSNKNDDEDNYYATHIHIIYIYKI